MPEFNALDWMMLGWSGWEPLHADSFADIPREPGLYRVRHRSEERPFLEYIGESANTRRRIQALARGTYADEMPYRDPHTAAPCLWAVRDSVGPELEISHVTPAMAEDGQLRKSIEHALIALHRREVDQSPTANFGRMIDGYRQSSYSGDEPCYKGGVLEDGETELNTAAGVGAPPWENQSEPRSANWIGLDWSEPFRLRDRLDANPPEQGLYRIWYEGRDGKLAYVGESSNIPSRLYKHENTFGGHALFSYVERIDLTAAHKRQELETDLIGAYYLCEEEPPLAQFGYTEELPF